MLVENVEFLSTRQLVNLIRAPVVRSVLCACGSCSDPSCDLSVGECTRVVLVQPLWILAIFKYAIV